MYLLYLDESGNPDSQDDRYFVMGGIALFERQVYSQRPQSYNWLYEQDSPIEEFQDQAPAKGKNRPAVQQGD